MNSTWPNRPADAKENFLWPCGIDKNPTGFIAETWADLDDIYWTRKTPGWRKRYGDMLNGRNGRVKKLARAELCHNVVLVLKVAVYRHDLPSGKVIVHPGSVRGLPISWIMRVTGLSSDQVERALYAIKSLGFECHRPGKGGRRVPMQRREYRNDIGEWCSHPAVRMLHKAFWAALGLAEQHAAAVEYAVAKAAKAAKAALMNELTAKSRPTLFQPKTSHVKDRTTPAKRVQPEPAPKRSAAAIAESVKALVEFGGMSWADAEAMVV